MGARARLLGEEALRRKLQIRPAPPLPPDAPPLREVVAQLAVKTRQLNAIDDQIARALATIEQAIRDRRFEGGPVDVAFPPWGKLGWSGRRGRWRLVVVDEDACEDLADMPRACRAAACLVLPKLVSRLGSVTSLRDGQKVDETRESLRIDHHGRSRDFPIGLRRRVR